MKLERSNVVDLPLWRKKVDSSLLQHKGTTIPGWACSMWGIQEQFKDCRSKKKPCSSVAIIFDSYEYQGWVTEAPKEERRQLIGCGIPTTFFLS